MPKLKIIALASIFVGTLLIIPSLIINFSTKHKTFNDPIKIPKNKVGILLGTSKYVSRGTINLYYKNRIEAASELFHAGKIEFILISGDNSQKEYNEPKTIRTDLIEMGIPSDKIFLDYAGFRTWDSIIRAKKIFGETNITVISQKFHNERAIFIGYRNHMNIVGYNAKDVSKYYGSKTRIREFFARIKLMIDIVVNKQPRYLGETIEIQ